MINYWKCNFSGVSYINSTWQSFRVQYKPSRPLLYWINFKKYKDKVAFPVNPQHGKGTSSVNPSPCKVGTLSLCIANTMAVDDLGTQGVTVSAAMILSLIFQNVPVSASKGFGRKVPCFWGHIIEFVTNKEHIITLYFYSKCHAWYNKCHAWYKPMM